MDQGGTRKRRSVQAPIATGIVQGSLHKWLQVSKVAGVRPVVGT